MGRTLSDPNRSGFEAQEDARLSEVELKRFSFESWLAVVLPATVPLVGRLHLYIDPRSVAKVHSITRSLELY